MALPPLIIERIKEQIEPLPHGRMGERGVADLLVRKCAEHCHLQGGNDLAGVVPQQGATEDQVSVCIHDGLPSARRVVMGLGPRNR